MKTDMAISIFILIDHHLSNKTVPTFTLILETKIQTSCYLYYQQENIFWTVFLFHKRTLSMPIIFEMSLMSFLSHILVFYFQRRNIRFVLVSYCRIACSSFIQVGSIRSIRKYRDVVSLRGSGSRYLVSREERA